MGATGWIVWQVMHRPEPAAPEPAPAPSRLPERVQPPRLPLPSASQPVIPTPPNPATPSAPKPAVVRTSAPIAQVQSSNARPADVRPPPRPKPSTWELQMALAHQGISVGCIDGRIGSQTRQAIRVYQRRESLPVTGEFDERTVDRLGLDGPAVDRYTVTAADLDRLKPVPSTWLGKSQQDRLDYETILELVSERSHAHPDLLRQLNPDVDWGSIQAGQAIAMPRVHDPPLAAPASWVSIRLAQRVLQVYDTSSNLVAHFPCSIALRLDKRPIGEFHVTGVVRNPDYLFHPEVFPESAEGRRLQRKLRIPPGPNNPVGVVWIGLSRPGYGIHGTPHPESVGRTESHGCFRLANWNVDHLAKMVSPGTRVLIEP